MSTTGPPLIGNVTSCSMPYFDHTRLGDNDSSPANELFITEYCVPNRVKYAFFVLHIVAYTLFLLAALLLLARSFWRTGNKITIHKLIYGCIVASACCELISMVCYYNAVESPYKYIIVPFGTLFSHTAVTLLLHTLFTVRLDRATIPVARCYGVLFITLELIAWLCGIATLIIFPIVAINNGRPDLVNLAYAVWILVTTVVSLIIFTLYIRISVYIYRKVFSNLALRRRFKIITVMCCWCTLQELFISFTFLWYINGYNGVFYFQFILVEWLIWWVYISCICYLTRATEVGSTNGVDSSGHDRDNSHGSKGHQGLSMGSYPSGGGGNNGTNTVVGQTMVEMTIKTTSDTSNQTTTSATTDGHQPFSYTIEELTTKTGRE